MIGREWATEPLSRIAIHNLSFQQLYGELEAANQLSKEEKMTILRDNIGPKQQRADDDESKIAGVLYAGQGRYAYKNSRRAQTLRSKKPPQRVDTL